MIEVGDEVVISKKMIVSSYIKEQHLVVVKPHKQSYNSSSLDQSIFLDAELFLSVKRRFKYPKLLDQFILKHTGEGTKYHTNIGGIPYFIKEAPNYDESGILLYYRADEVRWQGIENAQCCDTRQVDPEYIVPDQFRDYYVNNLMGTEVTNLLSGVIVSFLIATSGSIKVVKNTTQNHELLPYLSDTKSDIRVFVHTSSVLYKCSPYLIRKK